MKFEYLLFNLFILLGPSLAYFLYPKVVKLRPKVAIFSIGISAFLFIVWDIIVTGHFWDFNHKYVLGYKLLTIPVEEALFFFTVPFACLFLYVNFIEKFENSKRINVIPLIAISFFIILLSLIFLFFGKYYTFSVLLLLGIIWLSDLYFYKTSLVTRYTYWKFMALVLLLTAFFNYYLTSRPIVIYNNTLNINYRILTIPIEDFIYSICLMSLLLIIYEFIRSLKSRINKPKT